MISNRGLRHLALRVTDVERAKEFYMRVFGMRVVWQPDPDNVYLSSGCDNLALHRDDDDGRLAEGRETADTRIQSLHHLGFIVPTIAEVEAGYEWARSRAIEIVQPLRHHRDDSVSFYIRDPDGNVVQVLYEPSLSPLAIVDPKA
jgi:catechol 2,3-dioxygenase-like lactoylglutathione lyase family enzyme